MRSKEEAHDYRYFPDPDLLPLELDQAWVDAIAAGLPELPDARKARFVADYGVTEYDAGVLTAEAANASYFEAVAAGRDGKQAANWVINELFGRLNREGHGIEASPVAAGQLGGLIDLVASGEISGKIAKDVFEILWTEGGDPATIVATRGPAPGHRCRARSRRRWTRCWRRTPTRRRRRRRSRRSRAGSSGR